LADLLGQLRGVVGAPNVLTGTDAAPYCTDWRKRFTGQAQAVVRPANAQEVAAIVTLCAQTKTPVVPQGGNTGLVGGATPDASGNAIVLSLARMNRIRSIDTANNTLVAEAGCVLQTVQEAAAQVGRLFPLSLAAEGSATLGGNLSTNAGGTQVLRYGNARELCLGLEVVTPQGDIWNGLTALRKNNTGYDLRDLFIGAEGTLGIITAACVKLFALPRTQVTALAALNNVQDAVTLLGLAQAHCGPTLTGFELFSDFCLQLVEKHFAGHRSPFGPRHAYYALLEISDHEDENHAQGLLESLMQAALKRGLIQDAVVSQSVAQSRALWALRENISEAQAAEGKNIKHDISVPISNIAAFVQETDALLQQHFPGVRMVTFGHMGDGNLHYNCSEPAYGARTIHEPLEAKMAEKAHENCVLESANNAFLEHQTAIYALVHDQVHKFGGSFSAEHGVGQLKRAEMPRYKSAVELQLMRVIKHALDPLNIMNPGKIL
jgi:FAD/FMN-containing dehydrogenase